MSSFPPAISLNGMFLPRFGNSKEKSGILPIDCCQVYSGESMIRHGEGLAE